MTAIYTELQLLTPTSESNIDMTQATLWWIAAGAAVAIELATGTFYLLMIARGQAVRVALA